MGRSKLESDRFRWISSGVNLHKPSFGEPVLGTAKKTKAVNKNNQAVEDPLWAAAFLQLRRGRKQIEEQSRGKSALHKIFTRLNDQAPGKGFRQLKVFRKI